MDKKRIIIQKLPNHYVGEDCVQVRVPYSDDLTILDGEGIFFHSCNNNPSTYINKYLDDERSKNFPYHNIPTYKYCKLGHKVICVNQLFDFYQSYVLIGPGYGITEEYVIKDNEGIFLVKNNIELKDSLTLRKRFELNSLFEKRSDDEKIYYLSENGEVYSEITNDLLPLEKEIRKVASHSDVYPLNNGKPIIVIRIGSVETTINGVLIDYVRDNCYRVNETNYPVTKYTLNMIKCLGLKIRDYTEPRIALWNNSNIKRKDIKEAKEMVKRLKKNPM